ncbi:MAG: glycine zipper domain-containing protein [Verrucomicrobiota bacterium]
MAQTSQNYVGKKIVGGVFKNYDDANDAVAELLKQGYSNHEIGVLFQTESNESQASRREALHSVGYDHWDQVYLDKEIEAGRTLVSVTNVSPDKTGDVVQILNRFGSHYNPDGSRNVRDDVVGMTTGAAIGAAAGVFTGPIGMAIGALTGAAIGAFAGTEMERAE